MKENPLQGQPKSSVADAALFDGICWLRNSPAEQDHKRSELSWGTPAVRFMSNT